MKNSELLTYEGDNIGGLEKQRRYILRMLAMPMPCPNCATRSTWFQATGVEIDAWDPKDAEKEVGECPSCKRWLIYTVPMMGIPYWRLIPVAPPAEPQE